MAWPLVVGSVFALLATSCTDDDAVTTTETTAATSTTSTTEAPVAVTTTATTTTTTLPPSGPPLASEGDTNETVEAFQFLLNCNGYGDLTVDGVFGPATLAAVEAAQTGLGREVTGAPDEETMAELSRSCAEARRIDPAEELTVVGNAAPGDPEIFEVALLSNSTLAITVTSGKGITVMVRSADGTEVVSADGTHWDIDTTQTYVIEVGSESDPVTFELEVAAVERDPDIGDWIIATDGITYKGTALSLGDDAETVIDQVFDFLGHGVRGAYEEFDTDWYVIDEPQELGLRGIFIEGFAFLFFGPSPSDPDRPETFERIRFEGPSDDADGNPRPDNYATTTEGITVGDTLADLQAAYGSQVTAGSNSEEHYYRYTDSGGELCFYFGPDEPTEFDSIIEIASECRS